MIRPVFKLASLLSALLSLTIGVIHALPHSENQLRVLMAAPENCSGPCLLGIRPGTTTVDEAMQILQTHAWVDSARLSASGNGYGQIRWQWSGQQPHVIDDSYAGRITFYWDAEDSTGPPLADSIIETMSIQTHVRMYSLQAWYGQPDSGTADFRPDGALGYSAGYHFPGAMIGLSTIMTCPVNLLTYWNARTRISVNVGHYSSQYVSLFDVVKMC